MALVWDLLVLMFPQPLPTPVPGREGPCPCVVLTVLYVVSVPSCPATAAISTCHALPRGWGAQATDAQSQHCK